MKFAFISTLLCSFLFGSFVCAKSTPARGISSVALKIEDFVRVRIASSQEKIHLLGYNLKVQGEAVAPLRPIAIPTKMQKIMVSKKQMHGRWLWITKIDQQEEKIIDAPFLLVQGLHLQKEGHDLPEQVFLHGGDRFDLIGIVPLEDYVAGVLSSEMPWTWPKEALKAQAIAARSYAQALMRERGHQYWQVENSVLDQVYRHLSMNDGEEKKIKVNTVVQETKGVILVHPNGHRLKAYYHSDCGGVTASSQSVWGSKELVGGVVDSGCPRNPASIWSWAISEMELLRRVGFEKSELIAMDLEKSQEDQRVGKIKLKFSEGLTREFSAADFRKMAGYNRLRSTNFSARKVGADWVFEGKGFGHGVGLCQWGSRQMAEQGKNYQQILQHYYPESRLGALSKSSTVDD